MIKTVIVEDEAKGRDILKTLLTRYCKDIELIAEASNVTEAKKILSSTNVELLFLDIAMPDGNGFDVLKNGYNNTFEIIFTTAYEQYAIKAIKNNAADYLLKPLNILELQQAVTKAAKRIQEKKPSETQSSTISNNIKHQPSSLAIPVNDGLEFVPINSILYLTAKGSYTQIFCNDKCTVLSSKPLKDYEYLLPKHQFFRTHHSNIINLSYVKHYHRGDGGYVTMTNGSNIDISKRKKKDFLDLFKTEM
ncbi:MAG: response regulator transcription factor [Flavipsychrobacter sp.]|nr:response regulator transcription factor [Flavipsychrobacter sp.]